MECGQNDEGKGLQRRKRRHELDEWPLYLSVAGTRLHLRATAFHHRPASHVVVLASQLHRRRDPAVCGLQFDFVIYANGLCTTHLLVSVAVAAVVVYRLLSIHQILRTEESRRRAGMMSRSASLENNQSDEVSNFER